VNLNVSENAMKDEGARNVAKLVVMLSRLKTLLIYDQTIGKDGIKALTIASASMNCNMITKYNDCL